MRLDPLGHLVPLEALALLDRLVPRVLVDQVGLQELQGQLVLRAYRVLQALVDPRALQV